MSSRLPGMDPYLEQHHLWPAFQHHLAHALCHALVPGLSDSYRARVAERSYIDEQVLFTSVLREEHKEAYIEIRQRGDSRVVTLIEIISPANKVSVDGRQCYLQMRDAARRQNTNLVEIDLVLQGTKLWDSLGDAMPHTEYAVVVTRALQAGRCQVYTAGLQKPLPRVRVPLAANDRDTVIDLQGVFYRAYEQGAFASQIDYAAPPPLPLSQENLDWLTRTLASGA